MSDHDELVLNFSESWADGVAIRDPFQPKFRKRLWRLLEVRGAMSADGEELPGVLPSTRLRPECAKAHAPAEGGPLVLCRAVAQSTSADAGRPSARASRTSRT